MSRVRRSFSYMTPDDWDAIRRAAGRSPAEAGALASVASGRNVETARLKRRESRKLAAARAYARLARYKAARNTAKAPAAWRLAVAAMAPGVWYGVRAIAALVPGANYRLVKNGVLSAAAAPYLERARNPAFVELPPAERARRGKAGIPVEPEYVFRLNAAGVAFRDRALSGAAPGALQ